MQLFDFGGGNDRSTPPQSVPPFVEKYPRIGSLNISFEPAARTLVLLGSMVMNVSLCGPHSFETSTLLPKLTEFVNAGAESAPLFRMNWYLSHQVGSCVVLPAETRVGE